MIGGALVAGLRLLDPETAHRVTIRALAAGLSFAPSPPRSTRLATSVFRWSLPHPIGLAAGFDKSAEAMVGLARSSAAFIEVGTVTPNPQPGNPRPRVFRLPADAAVINRYGFNNDGLDVVGERLRHHQRGLGIVGANVGANKGVASPEVDYAVGVRALAPYADYLVVNVSSPNTPGLRDLQRPEPLAALLDGALSARAEVAGDTPPPLLLKIAPDLDDTQIGEIVEVAVGRGVDGIIVSNTTVSRPDDLRGMARGEAGGLSGRPLFTLSTRVLAKVARAVDGRVPLVGVGGVEDGRTAYEKIRAGASLVQLYTALIYKGPGLFRRIVEELDRLVAESGHANIAEAVGSGIDDWAGSTAGREGADRPGPGR